MRLLDITEAPPPNIARSLTRIRQLRGMKQGHLADLMGVSQATVSRWEAGRQRLPAKQGLILAQLFKASLDPRRDAYLKRLVETSTLPVHLVCDVTHRLLAASPRRQAEWGRDFDELKGVILLPYAPEEIIEADRQLLDVGWLEGEAPRVIVGTDGCDDGLYKVPPSVLLWERIQLSDGSFARLTTSIEPPSDLSDVVRLGKNTRATDTAA